MTQVKRKWRPSLALVIGAVCVLLISIPVMTLLALRLTSNQFIRATETSLIEQGAIYAQAFSTGFLAQSGPPIGALLEEDQATHWGSDFHPARPKLNLHTHGLHAPRPDGDAVDAPADPRFEALYPPLIALARGGMKTTLAGVVFLDHEGASLGPERRSFAALPEVKTALAGEVGSLLRAREQDYDAHPLTSMSRDTKFRVFVAYPVIAQGHVIGAVYLSRTPANLNKFLVRQRAGILAMIAATTLGAALVGFLLLRLLSRPIRALKDASSAIAAGQGAKAIAPRHYGTRELADLGDSVLSMAQSLSGHARELSVYTDHVTHELKSPVTAIAGAAELLSEGDLGPAQRDKLLGNIMADAKRMNLLLGLLREMTKLRGAAKGGAGRLSDMLPEVAGLTVRIARDAQLPLPVEHGQIVLLHMAQNAREHGADRLDISFDGKVLRIADNGTGIAPKDAARVTDPFFTTRRDTGGTGMGLAISKAVLDIYDARIAACPNAGGAVFEITFAA